MLRVRDVAALRVERIRDGDKSENVRDAEIRRAARDEGMRFLRESALDKVRIGLTTLKEINKVTFIESMR